MSQGSYIVAKLDTLEPWPGLNPRTSFPEEELAELAVSIQTDGLLQPLSVVRAEAHGGKRGKLWIFAGERRFRAGKLGKVKELPVVVHDITEAQAHRLAGVENLDREDLTAIEEATWIARELELTPELTQERLAEELGRSQAWVANRVRLLALPKGIRDLVHRGVIAAAAARDLLLRFLKLDEKPRAAFFAKLLKELERADVVLSDELHNLVEEALRRAGATTIRPGWYYSGGAQAEITIAAFRAFVGEHAGECIVVPGSWRAEQTWTFAETAWKELVAAALAERPHGGRAKVKLEDVQLGPGGTPTTLASLKGRFGYDNVLPFEDIVDPSKIDPKHVARVTLPPHESPDGRERVALVYVGPKVRGLKGAKGRKVSPKVAEASREAHERRLREGAKLPIDKVLLGLLELARQSSLTHALRDLFEADGVSVEAWSQYRTFGGTVAKLEVSPKSLRRVAGALAKLALSDVHDWELESKARRAAETKVKRESKAARDAWIAEHAADIPLGIVTAEEKPKKKKPAKKKGAKK